MSMFGFPYFRPYIGSYFSLCGLSYGALDRAPHKALFWAPFPLYGLPICMCGGESVRARIACTKLPMLVMLFLSDNFCIKRKASNGRHPKERHQMEGIQRKASKGSHPKESTQRKISKGKHPKESIQRKASYRAQICRALYRAL